MGKSGLKAIANIPRSLRIQIHTRMIHVLFILLQIVSLPVSPKIWKIAVKPTMPVKYPIRPNSDHGESKRQSPFDPRKKLLNSKDT